MNCVSEQPFLSPEAQVEYLQGVIKSLLEHHSHYHSSCLCLRSEPDSAVKTATTKRPFPIVEFDIATAVPRPRPVKSSWESYAEELVRIAPRADQWGQKLQELDIHLEDQHDAVVSCLLDGNVALPSIDSNPACEEPTHPHIPDTAAKNRLLLKYVTRYAELTRGRLLSARLATAL